MASYYDHFRTPLKHCLHGVAPLVEVIVQYLPPLEWHSWQQPTDRGLEIPPDCQRITLDFELGCRTMAAGSNSTGVLVAGDWLCFHPGYSSPPGAFRVGASDNQDMGCVPAQNRLHEFHIELTRSGHHTARVVDGESRHKCFEYAWDQVYPAFAHNVLEPLSYGGCAEAFAGRVCICFRDLSL